MPASVVHAPRERLGGALVRALSSQLRGEGRSTWCTATWSVGLRYGVLAARLWRAPLVVSFYGYDVSSYPRERGDDVYAPLFARAAR